MILSDFSNHFDNKSLTKKYSGTIPVHVAIYNLLFIFLLSIKCPVGPTPLSTIPSS